MAARRYPVRSKVQRYFTRSINRGFQIVDLTGQFLAQQSAHAGTIEAPPVSVFLGYDFRDIIDLYPRYEHALLKLAGDSNPPLLYEIETTALIMGRHPDIDNLRKHGETDADTDKRRIVELMNDYIIPEMYHFGGNSELERIIRAMTPKAFMADRGAITLEVVYQPSKDITLEKGEYASAGALSGPC